MIEQSEKELTLQWRGETSDWSLNLTHILRSDSNAVSVSCVGSLWAFLCWCDSIVPPTSSFYSSYRRSLDNCVHSHDFSSHCKHLHTQPTLFSWASDSLTHWTFSSYWLTETSHDISFILFPIQCSSSSSTLLSDVLAPLTKQMWNTEVTFNSSFIPNKSHSITKSSSL